MTAYNDNPKPKNKREERSCQRTVMSIIAVGFLCSIVMCVVLAVLGPTIGNIFMQEIVYVEADYAIHAEPVNVEYRAPEYAARGGIFENGFYLHADAQTVTVTVENGIATVQNMVTITNAGNDAINGVFIVPLPSEQALETVSVEINGEAISTTPYTTDAGRNHLQALAQEHNDLSLLAYSNMSFIEADIFPLTTTQIITVNYTHTLDRINGLVVLDIPLAFPTVMERPIGQFSLTVTASDELPLRNIYPATLDLAIAQTVPTVFTASANMPAYTPPQNLQLYYAPSAAEITTNVLTYRENGSEDGYFLLLAEPAPTDGTVVAKDVMLVLDQSGSMSGIKWQQAQDAAIYILENLNPTDRFFVTTFSTGTTFFADELSTAAAAPDAIGWVRNASAGGGTNINDGLLQTLSHSTAERPTTLLFMTDGQATEGVTDTQAILQNLRGAVGENVRIFVFGVGDDVNTTLLDSIAREYRGETGYVRQNETIDTEISELYSKISSPVLTDIAVDFGAVGAGDFVPAGQLPDLYTGQQLILVGRYRQGSDNQTIILTGTANDVSQTYTFDNLEFQSERGGEAFIAQLWAARLAGQTLNSVRLGNEDPKLVNSIVSLSLRYGIITPYTEFLLEQDDVLTSTGQETANTQMLVNARSLQQNQTGAAAVDAADSLNALSSSRNYVATSSYGSYGLGGYGRQYVTITPTPLPAFEQNGLHLTITSSDAANSGQNQQYILSLDAGAFERALLIMQGNAGVTSVTELPVLISDLVNAYGIEGGIGIYNEAFGAYLPLVPLETALVDEQYVVAPAPIRPPPMRNVHEKTFILQAGSYTDTLFQPDSMTPETITVGSDAYAALIENNPDMLPYFAVGMPLIIVWDGTAYAIQ
jgi:Ca-activated chloride channel family protein